jgi:hypothetical protein
MSDRRVEWVLRVAVAGEFLGHGYFAWTVKPAWIPFITFFGFTPAAAREFMPWVGALDFVMATLALLFPMRAALLWMAFWGLFTASLRPLTGDSIFEFIERAPNCAAPLALLLVRGWPSRLKDWWR